LVALPVTWPLASHTLKAESVDICAVKGEVPPAQEIFMLPVLRAVTDTAGAAAREGTAAAIRQRAAAAMVLAPRNMVIV